MPNLETYYQLNPEGRTVAIDMLPTEELTGPPRPPELPAHDSVVIDLVNIDVDWAQTEINAATRTLHDDAVNALQALRDTDMAAMRHEADDTLDIEDITYLREALNQETAAPEQETVPMPNIEAPVFEMEVNTVQTELNELANQQPRAVLNGNYQQHLSVALASLREETKSHIRSIRRYALAQRLYREVTGRDEEPLRTILGSTFSFRYIRELIDPNIRFIDTRYYQQALAHIHEYISEKRRFLRNKAEYGPQQAFYNQQMALIRQRPRTRTTVDGQAIMDTVKDWDNVWGVAIKRSRHNDEERIRIRIGLRDIWMSESAQESRYDNPQPILLAPFYFTIELYETGRFVTPSGNGCTQGLSRSNVGATSYDIHPHQLSDTPCFGTFGQTFNNMATKGDMISLIGGIIAFYSQYNSQDSAGVAANMYHPANIMRFFDSEQYRNLMVSRIRDFADFKMVNQEALEKAMGDYLTYHNDFCNTPAPVRSTTQYCYSCEEYRVSDDDEYFIDCNDHRICNGCWQTHYCPDCEHHVEDCVCDPDD